MNTKVKICCISSEEEAKTAIHYGATAIGLVAHMPSGPGVITDDAIKAIAASVPSHIHTFLLTSRQDAQGIVDHVRFTGTNTVQIVDKLLTGTYRDIRNALPAINIVQVIHVQDETSIDEALLIANDVDALLLDSGAPNAALKTLGGTGKTHNWDLSKKIVERSDKPVYLAGGLNADNIQKAVKHVQPYGVDLCSSVRTNGLLDKTKLSEFFKRVQNIDINI